MESGGPHADDPAESAGAFSILDFVEAKGGAGPPSFGHRDRHGPRPRPAVLQSAPSVLKRNDTSFAAKSTAKLRKLHGRYMAALADAADPEHWWACALKYYQY